MLPLWRACSAFRANSSRFLSPGPSKFRGFHSTALLLKNHYETLGVPETADGATIKKAFYEKVRLYHPDVSPGNKEHQKIFIEVSDAYQVLRDTDQRREYDASLRGMSFDFGGGRPRSGRRQGESFGGNSFSEEDFMRMYSEQFHDVFEELQRATRNSRHRTAYGPRSYTQQTKDGNVRYEFHFGGSDFFGGGRRGGQMNPFEFLQMMDFNPFGRSKSYSADPSRRSRSKPTPKRGSRSKTEARMERDTWEDVLMMDDFAERLRQPRRRPQRQPDNLDDDAFSKKKKDAEAGSKKQKDDETGSKQKKKKDVRVDDDDDDRPSRSAKKAPKGDRSDVRGGSRDGSETIRETARGPGTSRNRSSMSDPFDFGRSASGRKQRNDDWFDIEYVIERDRPYRRAPPSRVEKQKRRRR
eukprot:TRINITY_DN1394_c0_g1_i1.p1 TRINITY_DN1394_c0_g1~~TRINITY_DN1394_c0_g1_i1.p1  ORF type:complete len:412 (-),score=70.39 TRINITY_DN1394_c0_g1_i1:364-1599(-)